MEPLMDKTIILSISGSLKLWHMVMDITAFYQHQYNEINNKYK